VLALLVVAGSGMTGGGVALRWMANATERPGVGSPPTACRRWRISPFVLSAQNLGPLIFPRRNSLALICGVWWAGSAKAIKVDRRDAI